MKTTLEIPDKVFRRAKSTAAAEGIPLRQLVTEALEANLAARTLAAQKPWRALAGKLKHLHADFAIVDRAVEEAFEQIEPEDRP